MENSLEDRMTSLTDLDTQQKSDAITVNFAFFYS